MSYRDAGAKIGKDELTAIADQFDHIGKQFVTLETDDLQDQFDKLGKMLGKFHDENEDFLK